VLTLQGAQGLGKSSWVGSLVSDLDVRDMIVKLDHHLDPHDKDSVLSAIAHLIVEIGELDSSFRKDIARLKGFITRDFDKVRRPYARAASEYPRRTVFAATVNDGNFLIDDTGNSRFWTLPLVAINYEHGIDMQQVFAQLKGAYALSTGSAAWRTVALSFFSVITLSTFAALMITVGVLD
jgi:putative DNA primase/helicase